MALPWYAHNIAKYERKTAHLSMLQHGAYRLLLDHYYRTAAPLPAKLEQVHRICRAVAEEEQQAVAAVLDEFFELKGDGWHNQTADEELEKMAELSKKRSNSAKKRHASAADDHASEHAIEDANADAHAGPIANTLNTQPIPVQNQKEITSFVVGRGRAGKGDVTIEDPNDRLAIFQKKIAQELGKNGWTIVAAAADPTNPNYDQALQACKAAAQRLGKGWPRLWPTPQHRGAA